ncbi:DUF3772 domain-containing protein [Methylocapsa polymorpha]|uniref:DUF3772 domain-containing protein n=1 Tax=Methylocapsa polymorpha TaxID=3080828 RepID=A0ABZ0HQG6_9HYPH|nr:DUF3772 domain-containing protein [Methylocapsa sp. RX1]
MPRFLACALCLIALLANDPARAQPRAAAPAQSQPRPAAQAPAAAPANPQPTVAPAQLPTGADLDKINAALKQIETSLERRNLTEADLQALRQQCGPISTELSDAIDQLAPRLGEIKTRLDQLGDAPDDKAPPENPAVTAERASQQKSYSDADELSKRAKLLSVRADQVRAAIAAKQRALFANSLFEAAPSLFSSSLWSSVWQGAPANLEAIRALFCDWIAAINARLDGWRMQAFWGGLGGAILIYGLVAVLARRVLSRRRAIEAPSRLLKILGAWWVALVIAVPPIAMIYALGAVLNAFNLVNEQLQPFTHAVWESVIRIALAAGIARGLFAPTRPAWRLLSLGDAASRRLVQVAIAVACVISATRVVEALNEIINVSLPFSVATRSFGAVAAAIALGVGIWRFGDAIDDDSFGPPVTNKHNWFDLLRVAAWLTRMAVVGAVLIGYPTFASFLLDQFVWICAVAGVLYMSIVFVDESVAAGFKPTTPLGHWIASSLGVERSSLELLGVLFSGLVRLALFGVAAFFILVTWGFQSADVPLDFRTAFFGFKVGDVNVSPFNITAAIAIFGFAYAIAHSLLRWVDLSLLPHTSLDQGLRNSIKTSLGYVGFIIAASLALGYLGLSFEKLALVAGALSVGIGFGLQSIVNNFVSGLILLWERAIAVGDWIVVGADQGYVRRINVRSTEIETFDRSQVIIPNSSLVTGVVKNLVRTDRTGRLVIPLTVAGTADPEKVREVLVAIAKTQDLVLKIPAPQILFKGMSASALDFELSLFVADVESSFRIRSDLHFEIFKRFKAEGFFDAAPPAPTKIQIAGIEYLAGAQKPPSERAQEPPRSAAASR